jgi:DNA-binding NarL/FixJ family response regulator
MRLTPRHREVLSLIATGLSDKEIAEKLGIVKATVAAHKHQIRNITEARTPVALYKWAVEHREELAF